MGPPPEEEKPAKAEAAPAAAPATSGPRYLGHPGAYLSLSFGYNWWSLSRATVSQQVGSADDTSWFFDASLQHGAAAGLRGGYNILGHAHVGFSFMGTGWEVFSKERGGGGYIGGEVGWHPLSLVFALLSDRVREKSGQQYYDLFFEGGVGFGIVGKHRAMQGGVGTIGLGTEAYPAPWVSIGLRASWYYPFFNEYILNYDERTQPGNTIRLPKGSGGRFMTCTGYLSFHFGLPEER